MKEKEVLYLEEDDTSQLGANGKQVFVTKRINGKTEHNKSSNEKNGKQLKNKKEEELANNEILIDIDKLYFPDEPEIKNKKNGKKERNTSSKSKSKQKTKKSNSKKTSKKQQKSKNTQKKKQKRGKKGKILVKILILLIIIIGTVIFALVSPIFNIQTITVQGNNKISTETIISLSQLQTGKNIFQNLKSEIINNIKEEPYINDVKVKRVLPGTIEISVEERTVAYQIQVIDSYVYIDYQGYILEKSSTKADVPILTGMSTSQDELLKEKRISSDDISKLNVILKIVENAKKLEIYDLITQINTENGEYVLYLQSEKKYIYLGDGSDIVNKMMYAQIIIQNEKGNSGKAMINGNLEEGFNPYFSEEDI